MDGFFPLIIVNCNCYRYGIVDQILKLTYYNWNIHKSETHFHIDCVDNNSNMGSNANYIPGNGASDTITI